MGRSHTGFQAAHSNPEHHPEFPFGSNISAPGKSCHWTGAGKRASSWALVLLWEHTQASAHTRFLLIRIFHAIYLHQKPQSRHSANIPGLPMPFAGNLVDFETVMILKLPFISCPCFFQSPRLICLQILIGSHLLGCLILCFGVSPNTRGIASSKQSSAHTFPVPNVSTCTITGCATPIA